MMRILELWAPGPRWRPIYVLPPRIALPVAAQWDRYDLQSVLGGVAVPHHRALHACSFAWQSISLQLALLLNGYARVAASGGAVSDAIALMRRYDVLVWHWQSPEQIAWCLYLMIELRKNSDIPKAILWGRHTSYGRDASADLVSLRENDFLSRLLDVIICSSEPEMLKGAIGYIAHQEKTGVKRALIAGRGGFSWTDASGDCSALPGILPEGNDLVSGQPRAWCGIGLPAEWVADSVWISWQAADAEELEEGLKKLTSLKERGKNLQVFMPAAYPWLARKNTVKIREGLLGMNWVERDYHVYNLSVSHEVPDLDPERSIRLVPNTGADQ